MNWMRYAVTFAAGAVLLASPAAWAENEPVAKVIEIKGPKLEYFRSPKDTKPYLAYLNMDTLLKDQLQTDAQTVAALEFITGGRVGINKGTRITVISESDVRQDGKPVVKRIKLNNGRIYAKMGKRKDTLEIETNGGVMGIKGTEFSIESEPASGTKLAVYEGEVEFTPKGGTAVPAPPGTVITIPWTEVEVVPAYDLKRYEDVESLREQTLNSPEWRDFTEAMNVLSYFTNYVPTGVIGAGVGGAYEALYYASAVTNLIDNPEQAAADMALDAARSHVPGGGWIPGGISVGSSDPPKPDFPTNPSPATGSTVTSPPTFSWTGVEDAEGGYLLLLSRDKTMQTLDWSAMVKGTTVTYPAEAAPLAAGTYYWRVMGLNDENKPVGRATETIFTTPGWPDATP